MTTTTPASDETDRLVKILMDEESASISTHPEYAELMHDIRKHMRALQAENEGLNKLVAAQHGAMRTDWKDLIAERDKYKAEADSLKEWKNSLEEYRLTPKYGGWYELGIESSGDRVFVERKIK